MSIYEFGISFNGSEHIATVYALTAGGLRDMTTIDFKRNFGTEAAAEMHAEQAAIDATSGKVLSAEWTQKTPSTFADMARQYDADLTANAR